MKDSRRDSLVMLAFFLSGAAGLGYELLWTRLLATALGNETLGVLGVLAGFFGGMALGAAALHRRARESADPLRLFVRLELVAAAYALASPWVLHAIAQRLPATLAGPDGAAPALALTILVSGASLLPATFCMGATLPALVEARRRHRPKDVDGTGVGLLYAANTLGATVGVLATVHVILPAAGLGVGALLLSLLGVASAAVAWRSQRGPAPCPPAEDAPVATGIDASADPDPDVANEPWLIMVVLGGTGLLGVGLEVAGVQVLSQLFENTIYTFADILAVYLIGTALGSAVYGLCARWAVSPRPATVLAGGLIASALATIFAAVVLGISGWILDSIAPDGSGFGQQLFAEMVLASLVFGPATLVMGATFSHAAGLIARHGIGRAYAVNTLGSAIAPLLLATVIIPSNGYRDTLFVIVYGYLLVFGIFTWFRRFKAKWQVVAILGVVVATVSGPSSLVLVEPDDDWETLEIHETVMGLVIVSEQPVTKPGAKPLRRLQVGRHFRMGGALAFGERRMGHIPLLLHPEPSSALFLGVGTGATLGAVADYPTLQHVDAVELIPAVVDQLHFFEDINKGVANLDHVHVHAADARRFAAASQRSYDVIVADLFHPGRDGAGGLYAREHFEAVREHLAEGGHFAQWVPLYQVDRTTLETIIRTFTDVFDDAHAVLGVYNVQTPALVLIGRATDQTWALDPDRIARRVTDPIFSEVLMQEPRDLMGAYLMDHEALTTFAGEGPINTDLNPVVLLGAPRAAYEGEDGRGWSNLEPLLEARRPIGPLLAKSSEQTDWAGDAQRFSDALAAYLRAEVVRSKAGAGMYPDASIDAYLQAYEHAPEFAPARGMLFMAARNSGRLADRIYPQMLERTPREMRVYKAYVERLRGLGDEARLQALRAQAEAAFGPP